MHLYLCSSHHLQQVACTGPAEEDDDQECGNGSHIPTVEEGIRDTQKPSPHTNVQIEEESSEDANSLWLLV